jgi:hypothetical protein
MKYTWRPANGLDVKQIVDITYPYLFEVQDVWTIDEIAFSHNITLAIVNQFFSPTTELFSVATDSNNNIVAYTWAKKGEKMAWSNEEMLSIKFAHLKIDLSNRDKISLIKDMLDIWESFAKLAQVNIICSTTMRETQSTFLKLHERKGYIVRGSAAYKRLPTRQVPSRDSLQS